MATWPVLDGDPRWEEKLDTQMSRLRTRLQKRLSTAKGEKKASLVAQLKELREDFQSEHARLAESEKSGGYVVAKAVRKGRPKAAIDSAAEMIGAALGRVVSRLDAWKSDRAMGAIKPSHKGGRAKAANVAAAAKGKPRATRRKREAQQQQEDRGMGGQPAVGHRINRGRTSRSPA